MVFNVVPTLFEVVVVSGILTLKCGPSLAALTVGTLAAYTAFTFSITQVWGRDTGVQRSMDGVPMHMFVCSQHGDGVVASMSCQLGPVDVVSLGPCCASA
jgi:hypothetical protein